MKIDTNDLLTLWYENDQGNIYVPGDISDVPKGYKYQHVQFPFELIHTVYCQGEVLFKGSSTYNTYLVTALVRQSFKEFFISLWRTKFKILPKYNLTQAILIATHGCERCINVLFYNYGLNSGYAEFSDEWYRIRTSCKFCSHLPKEKPTIENKFKHLLN